MAGRRRRGSPQRGSEPNLAALHGHPLALLERPSFYGLAVGGDRDRLDEDGPLLPLVIPKGEGAVRLTDRSDHARDLERLEPDAGAGGPLNVCDRLRGAEVGAGAERLLGADVL